MKFLVLILFISLLKTSFSSKLQASFKEAGIAPDVLNEEELPTELLQIEYNNIKVDLGNEITPKQVKNEPKVSWKGDKKLYYTLIMVDPDAPSRQNPKLREVKHWLVGNIKGTDIQNGDHIAAYFGSRPPKNTGLHRYIFLVYEQPGNLNYTQEPRSLIGSREHRFNFSTKKFVEKYKLGHPIAANYYEAQWDEYVDEVNGKQ